MGWVDRITPTGHIDRTGASPGVIPRPLKVGVGGAGDGKTRLIDALRRRYGRRRAVVAPPDRPIEVTDPAVDLATAEGIDVIERWRGRELLLEPWRGRRAATGEPPSAVVG